ncbi:universal stress protein [uncultured Arthrobacter sp.]|uniref:universal stress protein n=1 Tax=uncultured Arthrobacter sp. TaxID=114050 RepID=UPI003216F080
MSDKDWPDGPILLGVGWEFSEHVVRTAAVLATTLGQHLVCAFVDPASYLTEWDTEDARTARSLDPAVNDEAEFPAEHLLKRLEALLGQPGESWSFRVLNGDVARALVRLADSIGAPLVILGAGRPGALAWIDRQLEGPVAEALISRRARPVLVVPDME